MTTPIDAETESYVGRERCLLSRGPACAIADAYLDEVTAFWLGTSWRRPFADWLAGCWQAAMPPRPDRPAIVISPHGGGGRGIVWYEVDGAVLGYIPGVPSGYQLPSDHGLAFAILPHCPATREKAGPTTTA